MGRLPDPNALRRDRPSDKETWTNLPAAGRKGRPPNWPLVPYVPLVDGDRVWLLQLTASIAEREHELWVKIWQAPQAVAWSRLKWSSDVALYVRMLVLAERGDFKAMAEVRAWSDRLGLNPAAMQRMRWRITDDEVTVKRETNAQQARPVASTEPSVRDRMKLIDGAR